MTARPSPKDEALSAVGHVQGKLDGDETLDGYTRRMLAAALEHAIVQIKMLTVARPRKNGNGSAAPEGE